MDKPLLILSYRRGTPPTLSVFAYFRTIVFALARLFVATVLGAAGLMMTLGGIYQIFSAGHPQDLPCAGVVWGSILLAIAVLWFMRALGILLAGRTYNSKHDN